MKLTDSVSISPAFAIQNVFICNNSLDIILVGWRQQWGDWSAFLFYSYIRFIKFSQRLTFIVAETAKSEGRTRYIQSSTFLWISSWLMVFDLKIFLFPVERDKHTQKSDRIDSSSEGDINHFPWYGISRCPWLISFCSCATLPMQQLISNVQEQLKIPRSERSLDQLNEKYVADVVSITIHGSVSMHMFLSHFRNFLGLCFLAHAVYIIIVGRRRE